MSKCFGDFSGFGKQKSKRVFATEKTVTETKVDPETALGMDCDEQNRAAWDFDFKSPEQYVKGKLKMLRKEMYIQPTDAEVAHLNELKTMGDIDRAVHSIIERHWSDD